MAGDGIDVVSAQFLDLKEFMTQRFNAIDHRLDTLESQELHESDIKHVNLRINDLADKTDHSLADLREDTDKDMAELKKSVQSLKDGIWKAAGITGSIVGLIVGLLEWAIPLIMR
ncbi:MAG: hypothetical protein SOI13_01670 [Bifidobacterium mongoliense]|jgi:hypothetical protein|uniref:hypothetical protein n=1 Tax=Bifidobacterium mongoliense TaxID=518643 RepID=UPI002F35D13D